MGERERSSVRATAVPHRSDKTTLSRIEVSEREIYTSRLRKALARNARGFAPRCRRDDSDRKSIRKPEISPVFRPVPRSSTQRTARAATRSEQVTSAPTRSSTRSQVPRGREREKERNAKLEEGDGEITPVEEEKRDEEIRNESCGSTRPHRCHLIARTRCARKRK